jgi:hypothetical protein
LQSDFGQSEKNFTKWLKTHFQNGLVYLYSNGLFPQKINILGEILLDSNGKFFRIVVAANFQEAILQIHFHPNDDESLQTVENPSVKEVDLANLQRILQKNEYFGRYHEFFEGFFPEFGIL